MTRALIYVSLHLIEDFAHFRKSFAFDDLISLLTDLFKFCVKFLILQFFYKIVNCLISSHSIFVELIALLF